MTWAHEPAPDRTGPRPSIDSVQDGLERDGYSTVGCLEAAFTDRLLDASNRIAADHHASARRVGDGRVGNGSLHLLSAVHRDPELIRLVAWPHLLDAAIRALSPNIYVHHSHLDIHPPERPSPTLRWHRDGGIQGREMRLMPADQPRLAVKAAVFLTGIEHPDDGAFELVPGSHRDGHTRAVDTLDDEAVSLCCPAGTVVLFDTRIWHRRRDNLRTRTRTAIFFTYTYRWIASRDDAPDTTTDDWARHSPLTRQLLGDRSWDPFYLQVTDLPASNWHPAIRDTHTLIR